MRIGCDVDGVLAEFVPAYVRVLEDVAGHAAILSSPFPLVWDFEELAGFTPVNVKDAWTVITQSDRFWRDLTAIPGIWDAIKHMDLARLTHALDTTFITDRMGLAAKWQTEVWLMKRGATCPTVLLTGDKAAACRLLNLDVYIDDCLSNANAVMGDVRLRHTNTRVYLVDAPDNRRSLAKMHDQQYLVTADERDPALVVVKDVMSMLKMEGI